MMFMFGFALGVLFCWSSLFVSFWLSKRKLDPLAHVERLARSKVKARIIEQPTDVERARAEVLEAKKDEGGVGVEELL